MEIFITPLHHFSAASEAISPLEQFFFLKIVLYRVCAGTVFCEAWPWQRRNNDYCFTILRSVLCNGTKVFRRVSRAANNLAWLFYQSISVVPCKYGELLYSLKKIWFTWWTIRESFIYNHVKIWIIFVGAHQAGDNAKNKTWGKNTWVFPVYCLSLFYTGLW